MYWHVAFRARRWLVDKTIDIIHVYYIYDKTCKRKLRKRKKRCFTTGQFLLNKKFYSLQK